MADHITASVSVAALGFVRGDCISVGGVVGRVTNVDATTLTIRKPHRWRWLEVARQWLDARVLWPAFDIAHRVRCRYRWTLRP